ncbi:hypothetical protein ACIBH1_47965 [Nonomuraea sp. NPDC050663]|uniref:hypothetical protein n=1 Tax=Nonomuraea sp. NPDC050663 TaxID=3364370 RepID=UPI0037A376AB
MNIADLARLRDEDLAREVWAQPSGAGARALMESIMAEGRVPAHRRSRWRRGLGLGVVTAGMVAALVMGPPLSGPVTEYANAAVSVKTGADYISVMITDPAAEAATFAEAFRAVGLDAEVTKVPVAPEDVGELLLPALTGDLPPGRKMTVSRQSSCNSAWCGTVSMPLDFRGKVHFGIGRPAASGERFAQPMQIIPPIPGGSPDGYDGRHKPVSQVRAAMEQRGMKITYVLVWLESDGSGSGYPVDAGQIKDGWLVESGHKLASGEVEIVVRAPDALHPSSIPKADLPIPRAWWHDG